MLELSDDNSSEDLNMEGNFAKPQYYMKMKVLEEDTYNLLSFAQACFGGELGVGVAVGVMAHDNKCTIPLFFQLTCESDILNIHRR